MDTTPSKKIMWSIGALLVIAIIIGTIVYFTGKRSPEPTPPPAENVSSGISPATVELLKQMSVTTSTTPMKSTLSTQEATKIKAAISAPATAKSSVRSSERQKLLDSMSVKQ